MVSIGIARMAIVLFEDIFLLMIDTHRMDTM